MEGSSGRATNSLCSAPFHPHTLYFEMRPGSGARIAERVKLKGAPAPDGRHEPTESMSETKCSRNS